MVVHLYGQSAPLDLFSDLAKRHGLHLVEDCAQAHGAQWKGRPCGSWGAFAGWSFYPTKNLGAIGDGGALTTNAVHIAESAKRLRNYGQSVRYLHPEIGMNSRLDELQAAILRERLKHLDEWTLKRRDVATALHSGISNPLVAPLPLPTDRLSHVHHLFVLTTRDRDSLQNHLKSRGVDSLCHYPVPVHLQDSCKGIRKDPDGLPKAELHAKICLSIPCHPGLTNEEVASIIEAVNSFQG